MTTPTDVANEALLAIGARATISSFSDPSPAAQACSIIYAPKIRMLLRAANWNCARRQVNGTLLKSLYINGVLSTNPPPQPFSYEYGYPSDCLKLRFVPYTWCQNTGTSPPLTTGGGIYPVQHNFTRFVPFVVGLDADINNIQQRVVLTNQKNALLVYTADISNTPDLWDSQFQQAVVATLGSFLVNPLTRNAALMNEMSSAAGSLLAAARATDGNESLPSQDHSPDWLRIRSSGGGYGNGYGGGYGYENCSGWESATFGNGVSF